MGKTHIQRVEKSTRSGEVPLSLCGMARDHSLFVTADQATCRRCLSYHRTPVPLSEQLRGKKEVRTTSSTGGQKGVKEAQYSLIPIAPLEELAVLFGRGARKYDVHQWRKGYELSKGFDAMVRHQNAFWSGLDFDVCSNDPGGCQQVDSQGEPFVPPGPDTCYNHTGAHHLIAVAWHAFVMRELVETHPEHDNRYIPNKE